MILYTIAQNWREAKQSDLRRSIKPFFKGDRSKYSSYRGGAETYLKIIHNGVTLDFWFEAGELGVSINGIDARESPYLSAEKKKRLNAFLSAKSMPKSERNRFVGKLIYDSLSERDREFSLRDEK